MDTVFLGGEEIKLVAPKSQMACAEIYDAIVTNQPRAFAAALGVCWQGEGRPRARYGADLYSYAAAVYDELAERYSSDELRTAGAIAWSLVASARRVVPKGAVEDRAGFSEAGGPATS